MARMFPEQPDSETKSQAERTLFFAFQKDLPEEYVIFHSIAWQVYDISNGVRDGEADFIVAHPELGVIILEVKGGIISYEGATGQWSSNTHPIKDPVRQARNAKFSLLAKLKETAFWQSRRLIIGYGVAFPDTIIHGNLRLDAPRELVLDGNDLDSLDQWLKRAFHLIHGERASSDLPPDASGIEELIKLLAPNKNFQPSLAATFRAHGQIIDRLTREQYGLINLIRRNRRLAIPGCAGSGKTLVAIETAVRLDRDSQKTLVLCHNPFLAHYIRDRITSPTIRVADYCGWVKDMLHQDGDGIQTWSHYHEPTDHELERAFDLLSANASERYDAIIVDEGQDFRDTWWTVVEAALINYEKGFLYIFYDDNQSLLPMRSQYPLAHAPLPLSRNCRNTGTIFEYVRAFQPQSPEPEIDLKGLGLVDWFLHESGNHIYYLQQATKEMLDHIAAEDILVLVPEQEISHIENLSFDIIPPYRWQDAIRKYLFGAYGNGLNEPVLSNYPFPTDRDISAVQNFAHQAWRLSIPWEPIPSPGNIVTRLSRWSGDGNELVLTGSFKYRYAQLAFFLNSDWIRDLPKPRHVHMMSDFNNKKGFQRDHGLHSDIIVKAISAAKGLEAAGVILYVSTVRHITETDLYVSISRARHALFLVVDIETKQVIERKLLSSLQHS
jgi:hypothetical protein